MESTDVVDYRRKIENYDELLNALYWVRNQFPKPYNWLMDKRYKPAGEITLEGVNLLEYPGYETERQEQLKFGRKTWY